MSKLSIAKRVLCSFIAAAMILSVSGCNGKTKKVEKSSENANIARQIVNYYAPRTVPFPDGTEYVSNINYANGNIYLSGYASSSSADNLARILNLDTKEIENVDLSMIDCVYISKVLMTSDKIFVCYADNNNSTKISIIDRASNTISKDAEIGTNEYISSVFFDESGNVCTLGMSFSSMTSSVLLKKYDENLAVVETVNVSEKLGLNSTTQVGGVILPDGNGSYYVSVSNYASNTPEMVIYKISSSFEKEFSTDELTDIGDYISNMFIGKNGNLCVASVDNQTNLLMVNEFDKADGTVLNRYELDCEGDAAQGAQIVMLGEGAAGNYDFIYAGADGIYGYSFADNSKTSITKYDGATLPDDFQNCYSSSLCGNELLMNAQSYGSGEQHICVMDMNGELKNTISMPQTEGYIDQIFVAENGLIYAVETIDNGSEDEGGNYISNPKFIIHVLDENGDEKNQFVLDDLGAEDGNTYIQSISVNKDGKVFICTLKYDDSKSDNLSELFVLDSEGNKEAEISGDNVEHITNVIFGGDADYLAFNSSDEYKICRIDYEKGKLGEELKLKSFDTGRLNYRIYPGSGKYDFYYSTSDAVYGCSIKEDKVTEIINWIDSDISIQSDTICPVDENTILCSGWEESSQNQELYILERVDEETLKKIQNKQIITVAGIDVAGSDMTAKIMDFNKNSDEYRLQVNDYGEYSRYEEDSYISGANKLNTDIAAGNVPDIVIGGYEVDMESYIAKGMFANLNEFIEKDDDIRREDYLENIFDMYSNDGKLYQLVTSFNISSLIGKASEVGKESGWTFDEFFDFVDSKSGKDIFYKASRTELVNGFISANLSEFVDFNKKSSDFNNDTFVKLLEFIKENGEDVDAGKASSFKYGETEEDYKNFERRFRDGKCCLELLDMYGFDMYNRMQTATVREEITPVGIPSSDSNGALVSSVGSIGISAKSDKKDAAWKFVRELLLEDYQDGLNDGYVNTFPVKKSSFDKLVDIAQSQENNMGYYQGDDGETIEMKPIDTESAEKILDLARNSTRSVVSDSNIKKIITEQTDTFFSGGQTAQETAEAIQSKVALYLKEIS